MESWCCTWRRFIVGNDIISLSADLSRRIHLARNRRTKAYQLCRILFPSRRYIRAAIVVVVVDVVVVVILVVVAWVWARSSGERKREREREREIEARPTRKGEEREEGGGVSRVWVACR